MTLKGKKVLVTGGSGFIPSHLVRRLVHEGADVAITTKYKSPIDNVRIVDVWEKITVLEADLRNQDSLQQIRTFAPDTVIHMAAYNHVGDSFLHYSEAMNSNAQGTVNLIEAYQDFKSFVYVSTSEVYGYQQDVPFTERMIPFPTSPYAVGKYAGELYARMKQHTYNLPIAVVRPFNAFGPYQSQRAIIPEIIIDCLLGRPIISTEGKQTRDFNYVTNLVDGILLVAQHPKAAGDVINIGSGHEISIRDLILKIHQFSHSTSALHIGKLPYRPTEIWRMAADSTKARQLVGWKPHIDLDTGLRLTIDWFKAYLAQFHDSRSGLHALSVSPTS